MPPACATLSATTLPMPEEAPVITTRRSRSVSVIALSRAVSVSRCSSQ